MQGVSQRKQSDGRGLVMSWERSSQGKVGIKLYAWRGMATPESQ